jgi:hypothetical protein
VARQFHCDRFRNSTPHHITHRRTAQVVKDEAAVLVILGANTGQRRRGRRMISAAGRQRIAAAQKARWAKIRAAKKK